MKEALYYKKLKDNKVSCHLCPQECIISVDKAGSCRARRNSNRTLVAENYGLLSSVGFDPIEKKPLYHYYPGKQILSIGTVGCNLSCNFCQNCEISQSGVKDAHFLKEYTEDRLLAMAHSRASNIGIAFTYNEPTVFFEFMMDVARLMQKEGMKNVIVSNGYINPGPLKELMNVIDACNIDLKAFTEKFYREQTSSSLKPVLDTLKYIKSRGKHLEVTNLLIPTLNDDVKVFREMVNWIATELGADTVFHISKYFPRYKAKQPSTPDSLLEKFYNIAREELQYVYIGNSCFHVGHNTYCPGCEVKVTDRRGYETEILHIDKEGKCTGCGQEIYQYI